MNFYGSQKRIAVDMERLTYTVDETALLLGLSRNKTYEAIARGDIPALRIGRRIIIPKAGLKTLLQETSVMADPLPQRQL